MKPALHFTHANGIPGKSYETFLSYFQDEYNVHYMPYIGMDKKFPVTAKWKYLVQEVILDIETHFPNQKVIGVGHSFGSLLTLMCAYQRPELFSQLVIMDPPFIIGRKSPILELIQKFNLKQVYDATPAGITLKRRDHWESKEDAYQALRHNRLFNHFNEQSFLDYMESGLENDLVNGGVTLKIPKTLEAEIFKTVPAWWWRTPRKLPQVPTYLITSKESHFYKQEIPQTAFKVYGIPFSVVEGTHMFPLEHSQQTAREVLKIINQHK